MAALYLSYSTLPQSAFSGCDRMESVCAYTHLGVGNVNMYHGVGLMILLYFLSLLHLLPPNSCDEAELELDVPTRRSK
jgi:hypothetical protein